MRKKAEFWFLVAGLVVLFAIFAGCSGEASQATPVPTTTAVGPKFVAGDIIAKTASSTDSIWLIVKYDAKTDKYERAFTYKKSDGIWYRKDELTELADRAMTEKLYPAKVTHVSSISAVPVVTPTTIPVTTSATATATTAPLEAPTVTGITPNTGIAGTTVNITGIAGTNFRYGALVRLGSGAATITGSGVTVVSLSNITCQFAIPSNAAPGAWNVTVINTDGQSGTLSNGFSITNTTTTTTTAAPPELSVTDITPNTGERGATISITNLAGTHFQTGATVNLTRSGCQNITASGVLASTSQIICTFALPLDAAVGSWNVVVTNPSGESGTLATGFTIKNPAPTISSIYPTSNVTGLPVTITNLAGTNFQTGATVKLMKGSTPIQATNVVVVSATQITSVFDLTGADAGTWNVMVTNPDSQSVTLSPGFTVSSSLLLILITLFQILSIFQTRIQYQCFGHSNQKVTGG
ncbi:MAG: hypothetical protein NTW33_05435 [Methanoregula sp.]|nr:hypothetical protein [Methanoregula sp.]